MGQPHPGGQRSLLLSVEKAPELKVRGLFASRSPASALGIGCSGRPCWEETALCQVSFLVFASCFVSSLWGSTSNLFWVQRNKKLIPTQQGYKGWCWAEEDQTCRRREEMSVSSLGRAQCDWCPGAGRKEVGSRAVMGTRPAEQKHSACCFSVHSAFSLVALP